MTETAEKNQGRVVGTLISPERLAMSKKLRDAGFVHVTGLPVMHANQWSGYLLQQGAWEATARNKKPGEKTPEQPERPEERAIQAVVSQYGRCDHNNGKSVIVTKDGEVWMGTTMALTEELVSELGLQNGACVPCSNGEGGPDFHYILQRLQDPYNDCHGQCSPIPNPRAANA